MKNVGILTQPLSSNYGGILQCYALYSFLKINGYQPFILRKNIDFGLFKKITYKLLSITPCQNIKNIRSNSLKTKALAPFIEKHLALKSAIIHTTADLKTISRKANLNAVIVGSDQVWRYKYIKDRHYKCFFLDFIDNSMIKKIAYSASFGIDGWEAPEKVVDVVPLLAQFNAVSVREDSGIKICEEIFHRHDVRHTLDPTLLVDPNIYKALIDESEKIYNSKISTYILDDCPDKKDIIASLAKSISPKTKITHLLALQEKKQIYTIQDWLKCISGSEYVITDSFHGMVFSIIFKKQFIAIVNNDRGACRFLSLAKQLGLESRLVYKNELHAFDKLTKKIDYFEVNEKISLLRSHSKNYLTQALEG
ncbi:hypothetical protein PS862_01352 [Pseudomonas fluorescens]|uniref:Polysaccharide pyruvyl transferase domain-containing protein n=1 Tax=Pseudomonas fluorescens TaxID=294 RepID=A0A5E7I3L5_PSEFL|nr:polysaccharide pyruvyl transferase family protein [Pseudomonas fluorescens]VVO71319.1 hypothetical protein PS862_01352 [Pseudomonas fluorescens]